jgi:cysteinyl-tRNA synthetase
MMGIRVYNTMTRQKQDFFPAHPPHVAFYSCGPTVYGEFHVGNARTFVNVDVIRRWLLHRGYKVRYVQNITDIDDKIIRRANQEGTTAEAIAEKYTAYFLQRLQQLGNLKADDHPMATKYVGPMVQMIRQLESRGHAYSTPDGSVWFEVGTFKEYGRLSQRPLDQMRQGERVDEEISAQKRSPLDFCLWKAAKLGEPSWPSPWGAGRPGWHIECSCMAMRVLGTETIDIHTGGSDLIFPHHENEIAQSEAATGKVFANYWLHFGMLNVDGEKISKSLGNMSSLDDVFKVISPLALRYFFMSARYRDQLEYSDNNLHQCQSATDRMVNASREASRYLANATLDRSWKNEPELDALWNEYHEGMDDDFNTPRALAALAQVVTIVNTRRTQVEVAGADPLGLSRAAALLSEMRYLLGLSPAMEPEDTDLAPETLVSLRALAGELGASSSEDADANALMGALIERRAKARVERDFAVADKVRRRLMDAGILLEDKPGQTVWKKA